MAIQFDATAESASTTGTETFAHTCTGDDRIIFASISGVNTAVSTASYAGIGMTQIDSKSFGTIVAEMWYLANPPTGANNVIVTGAAHLAVVSHSYTGVDITNPLGESQTAGATDQAGTVNVVAQPGWMVVDCYADQSDSEPASEGAGQTLVGGARQGGLTNDSNAQVTVSYELGSALTTMSWTSQTGGVNTALVAVALKPKGTAKVRAVKYFHDIYDPGGRIFDDLGRVVAPWELKPNNWIKVTGVFLPSSKEYSTFVQDPSVAYIEEVTFSTRGGLRIKTNRGEMTDVLLARAAGGKTL